VIQSVAAPGDTYPSDATVSVTVFLKLVVASVASVSIILH